MYKRTSFLFTLVLVFCASSHHAATGAVLPDGSLRFILPAVQMQDMALPARPFTIRKVAREYYEPNVLLVKTKKQYAMSGELSFPDASWALALKPLAVKKIDAPFVSNGTAIQSLTPTGIERIYEMRYDAPVDVYDACAALATHPDVEYVSPVFIRKTQMKPNDSYFSSQYALARIQAEQAFDVAQGAASVKIAIIDSGTDFDQEDLAANLAVNPGENGNDSQGRNKRTNGVDDDGNGFIDDWRGWDFVGNVSVNEYSSGTVREDNDPKNRFAAQLDPARDHGTNSAGCAAAVTNNGKGVASIGFKCNFIPIKCASEQIPVAVLRGYSAILYAARLGAKVINCSWGGPGGSPAEQDIINTAVGLGSIIVVSSGNDGVDIDDPDNQFYPALYDNVFVVGASNANDRAAGFSNYGGNVDVYAPGDNIRTTRQGNLYGDATGTSFSSPIVAGLVGLLVAHRPTWSNKQIMHQIRSTCDNVLNPSSRLKYYGRVNAFKAVTMNENFNSGSTVPGLEVSSVRFNNQPAVATTGDVNAVFTLRNYLGAAPSVNITLQLDGNAITLSQTSFQLSNVRGNDSVTFSCTARATSPYFIRDTVTAFVTMTSGTYVNYQTILLTVDLQTENTYSSTLSDVNITWRAAHARPPVAFWAVGKASQNRNAVLRGSTIDSTSIPDDVQCVFGLSNLSGMVGTTNSRIYRTTNGSTWSPVVVSSITSTVRGINFFDNSNGICIGVPAGGVWNTGVSNNGGQSWSVGTPLPAPAGLESTLAAAIAWQGNNGWVGTTLGRVFRTNDKGASWKEAIVEGGKAITQLSFANDKLGFALVRNSSSVTDPASVYHSTDGGATWAATGYVFNVSGLHPVAAYSPVNSKQFLATCSGSQVMMSLDSGRTWQPTPTGFGINAAAGFGLTSSNTATLYILGRNIGTLRLPLVADQRREIVLTATTLAFDSVDVGTSKTLSTQSVRNTSTLPVRLDSISIIPEAGTNAGEFRIAGTFSLPRTINPSESATIPVIFRPDATGERKATLRTKSDASNGDQTMLLIGNGRSTNTSVDEQRGGVSVTLYPQPVSTDATLHLRNAAGLALRCEILTLNGTLALPRIEGIATTDQTQLPVTVDALPPGVYIYRVTLGGTLHTGTFTIVR